MANEERYQRTTLTTIAGGALPELFAEELRRVMANIDDPNTPAKAKRSITIQITLEPEGSRSAIAITAEVRSKLASPACSEGTLFVVRDTSGELFAVENNTNQTEMFKS